MHLFIVPAFNKETLLAVTFSKCNCIPEKREYYGSCTVIVRVRRDFLVFNIQATFLLRVLLNLQVACYGRDLATLLLGIKILPWGVKNVKNFDLF